MLDQIASRKPLLRSGLVWLLLGCLVLVAVLVPAAVASANGAGAVTETFTWKNVTETFTDTIPCNGIGPAHITTISNGVAHFTTLTSGKGAGTFWGTFTETGSFTIVPDNASLPTYTGHFAVWDGERHNLNNDTAGFNLNIRGTGSDGSTLNAHLNGKLTITATGVTKSFDHLVCG